MGPDREFLSLPVVFYRYDSIVISLIKLNLAEPVGQFCETPLICLNGGHLVNSPAKGVICDCPARFRGLVCQEDNCVNGEWQGYMCKCPPGYAGSLCETVSKIVSFNLHHFNLMVEL